MANWGFAPFAVSAYDNPETIRMRKYVTGAHFVLRGTGIETGRTPTEVVWEKGKARLYRYGRREALGGPRAARLRPDSTPVRLGSGARQQPRGVPDR